MGGKTKGINLNNKKKYVFIFVNQKVNNTTVDCEGKTKSLISLNCS